MSKNNSDREGKHPHNPLQDHELEKDEVQEVLEFLRKNGTSIAIAIAIGVIASLGVVFYRNSQEQKRKYAAKALASAKSPESLMAITKEYKDTPSAPIAMLELAAEKFNQGEYEAAAETYRSFRNEYPKHDLAPAVKVCIAMCQEANGMPAEAISTCKSFLAGNSDHFMAPVATFTQARSHIQKGELEKARTVYEDFIAANPESDWVSQAESALRYVNKEIRARQLALNDE